METTKSDASILRPIGVIAAKDVRDAGRDHFIVVVTGFLTLAAVVALVTGATALRADVATYDAARVTLFALGKSADQLAAPEFYPLKLLRGAIEQTEIIDAAVAVIVGYRAAPSERGHQTLALMLTRPIRRWEFTLGKITAGVALLASGLAVVLAALAVTLGLVPGVGLTSGDSGRIGIVWGASVAYTAGFFFPGFCLTLHLRKTATVLLLAFTVWLTLVLVAPQIGDTLDPDNHVAGGVFQNPRHRETRSDADHGAVRRLRNPARRDPASPMPPRRCSAPIRRWPIPIATDRTASPTQHRRKVRTRST